MKKFLSENENLPYLLLLERSIMESMGSAVRIDDMQKEAFIKSLFGKSELTVTFYPSSGVYGMKIPAKFRREGIPGKITGKTREIVISKTFDRFIKIKDAVSDVTLTDLYNEFIEARRHDSDFAAHTVRKNSSDWNTFFKGISLVTVPVGLLQPSDLMEHFKRMTEGRKMTRHAFGNAKGLLNQLFDMAYERDLVRSNICRELSTKGLKFRPEDCKQDLVYSTEDRNRICDELDGSECVYDKAIIMQFCLGCRVSEVKALYWSDIDFDHKLVYIHREVVDGEGRDQIIKEQTKNGMTEGNRVLPLTERAERMLNTIPKLENKDSIIFHKDYKPLRTQTINDHLRNVCRELGIRYLSTHKIRAWGITAALESGMDQASIMRLAGHASPQTMNHYIRTGRANKDIGTKFSEVFN